MTSDAAPPLTAKLRPVSQRRLFGLLAVLAVSIAVATACMPELPRGSGVSAALLLLLAVASLRAQRRRRSGIVELRADGFHAAGELVVPRIAMRRASLSEDPASPTVTILCGNGMPAVLEVADQAHGRALLRALRLDADQARSSFDFDGPVFRRMPWWAATAYGVAVLGGVFPRVLVAIEAAARDADEEALREALAALEPKEDGRIGGRSGGGSNR